MKRRTAHFVAFMFLAFSSVLHAAAPIRYGPDEVLLIYNSMSPISKSVAHYYSTKRKITNVLTISCPDSATQPDNETISFKLYRESLEKPVREYLQKHNRIQFIVLTKGVPLRISGADTGVRALDSPVGSPLSASVDSHLASIDYEKAGPVVQLSISGSGATGIGWSNRYWNTNEPFDHKKFGGYLVTRLDGYTEDDAKALVDRSLAAERPPTTGKILFDLQPGVGLGDKARQPAVIVGTVISQESPWSDFNADMAKAHDLLVSRGIPDEIDLTEKFIGHRTGLRGYFSWGSNDAKFDNDAYQSLTFAPGSISDTAVSTSGRTFLPTQGGQTLLVDLIAHGLCCGKGYTDEPLLQAMSSPTILLDHYTAGFTMAESFYAASHFVRWQDVVVGDPLCAPYFKAVAKP